MASEKPQGFGRVKWSLFGNSSDDDKAKDLDGKAGPSKWSMGVLNDSETVEVPGNHDILCLVFAADLVLQDLSCFSLLTATSLSVFAMSMREPRTLPSRLASLWWKPP